MARLRDMVLRREDMGVSRDMDSLSSKDMAKRPSSKIEHSWIMSITLLTNFHL
jgi:hypothetical protein